MKQKLKNNLESLIGKGIIVHPFLTTDPYNNRGTIGIVKIIHPKDDMCLDITIEFDDKQIGIYGADTVFMLYPEKVIRRELISNADKIALADRKSIIEVVNLVRKRKLNSALSKAMANDKIQSYCCCSCQKWMELKAATSIKKNNRSI